MLQSRNKSQIKANRIKKKETNRSQILYKRKKAFIIMGYNVDGYGKSLRCLKFVPLQRRAFVNSNDINTAARTTGGSFSSLMFNQKPLE